MRISDDQLPICCQSLPIGCQATEWRREDDRVRSPEDERCLQSKDQKKYAITVSHYVCYYLTLLVSAPDDVSQPPPLFWSGENWQRKYIPLCRLRRRIGKKNLFPTNSCYSMTIVENKRWPQPTEWLVHDYWDLEMMVGWLRDLKPRQLSGQCVTFKIF